MQNIIITIIIKKNALILTPELFENVNKGSDFEVDFGVSGSPESCSLVVPGYVSAF